MKFVASDVSIPFNDVVLITLKSSPNGFIIETVFLSSESSGNKSLSNTFLLSNEYVIAWENPQNRATELAIFSICTLSGILPDVDSPDGSVIGILSYP